MIESGEDLEKYVDEKGAENDFWAVQQEKNVEDLRSEYLWWRTSNVLAELIPY